MSPLPSVTFRSELDPLVRKELDQLDGELTEYLLQEHDDDGRHQDITAKSLTVKGPVTITGGPVTINGAPVGGSGAPAAHAPSHSAGAADPVNVKNLAGYPGTTTTFLRGDATFQAIPAAAPAAHHVSHELGGSDVLLFPAGVPERGRGPMGEWSAVPYSASNFVGIGGLTWTVTSTNVITNRYMMVGKTLFWVLYINGSVVGGSPSNVLQAILPVGALVVNLSVPISRFILNGAVIQTNGGYYGGHLGLFKIDTTNFALGTLDLAFTVALEVA